MSKKYVLAMLFKIIFFCDIRSKNNLLNHEDFRHNSPVS